ncbi:carbohydrate kinase family protein [Patescibacteria group bacterium]|nr:carbohydrate kinase family protein [Patescibacteria group bacterium]MBU0964144.1 carbohydrate kinase family protein [Patescibacteria group bacterium]
MNILVSGSLAYDRIMNFDGCFKEHILPDKIHVLNVSFNVEKFRQSYGGTAGNIAYSLTLLGENPIVLSAYGNDFDGYKAWCMKNNINIKFCRSVANVATGSVYIITDKDDNQIAGFFVGAMKNTSLTPPAKFFGKSTIGIVSPGNVVDMRKYPQLYKKTKTPYIFDPGQQLPALSQRDLISGIQGSMALITNDYELVYILNKMRLSMKDLLSMSDMVVNTKGDKGSAIITKDKKFIIPPAKPKNTSDPTGAGDAYRAGFIKGLINGYPLPKVGRLAAVVSVYTVEEYGTQTHKFTWAELQKRYYQNFREKL